MIVKSNVLIEKAAIESEGRIINADILEMAFVKADELMKENKGHLFQTILKTRCINCGKSPKVKTKCGGWFQTYLHYLKLVLLNPEDVK
jgi:hypothetical protein